ncbi:30S ribosomal protein S6 [Patescibacteria group bacterium]|nr:30S ribosomal protein S6 [Patescibacteria group bacterium]
MKYELVYILTPKLSEEDAKAEADALLKKMEEKGVNSERQDFWGRRKLAYEINHLDHGYYVLSVFESAPSVPGEIEHMLQIEKNVLRSLIVQYEKEAQGTPTDEVKEEQKEGEEKEESKEEKTDKEKKETAKEPQKKEEPKQEELEKEEETTEEKGESSEEEPKEEKEEKEKSVVKPVKEEEVEEKSEEKKESEEKTEKTEEPEKKKKNEEKKSKDELEIDIDKRLDDILDKI